MLTLNWYSLLVRKGNPVVDVNTANELSSALVSNLSPLANPNGSIRPKRKRKIGIDIFEEGTFSSEAKCILIFCQKTTPE